MTGTQTNHTAVEQTYSSDILTAVAADLRATPKTSPPGAGGAVAAIPKIDVSPANPVAAATTSTLYFSPEGQCSSSLSSFTPCDPAAPIPSPVPTIRYRLTVTFLPNGTGAKTATFVNLKMTWPATPEPTPAGRPGPSSAETFVALDRN